MYFIFIHFKIFDPFHNRNIFNTRRFSSENGWFSFHSQPISTAGLMSAVLCQCMWNTNLEATRRETTIWTPEQCRLPDENHKLMEIHFCNPHISYEFHRNVPITFFYPFLPCFSLSFLSPPSKTLNSYKYIDTIQMVLEIHIQTWTANTSSTFCPKCEC